MLIQQETWITPLDETRTLHLYIPDGLAPGQKVPVLYMFDGHNLFVDENATYGKSWGLKDYLDQTGLPLVVVGLECNHEGNRRLWEFSPYDFADPVWGEVQGQGELLLDWMSGELKEWVDENLPGTYVYRWKLDGRSDGLVRWRPLQLGLQPGCLLVAISGAGHETTVRGS